MRPAERIATFDNDGTLWCEQPLPVQIFFASDRLKELATKEPGMKERQPFKAFLDRDMTMIASLSKQAALEIAFRTHAGVTEEEFDHVARAWLASAKHPELGRLFTQCVYRPQLELLEYLRMNGFKTFIVSGGGIDLIRGFAEEVYGIPPEQVIGSSVKTRLDVQYMLMTLSLAETAKFFVSIGLPAWLAYATFLVEAVGGILLILGIQTRWVALALSPILIGATWAHVGNGWVFTAANGGWEYPLYLFVLCIAQAMLGDGAFALAPSRLSGSGARKTMLDD